MIVLGIPVVNQHNLTQKCFDLLVKNTSLYGDVRIVFIDNASDTPLEIPYDHNSLLPFDILRNVENRGCFFPLLQLYYTYQDADFIGIMHNDVFILEQGWNERVLQAFDDNPDLNLLGFAGSDQADVAGGRGTGTMHNFMGTFGQPQGNSKRITDLQPAVLLDSLFMMFRRDAIPFLDINDDILLYHFYDKIWSMRMLEQNFDIGVLGVKIDHIGGMTANADEKYGEDAKLFCQIKGIPLIDNDAEKSLYYEGERRLLEEYRDEKEFIPCRIDSDWVLQSG